MKIENLEVFNIDGAIRGMRNPFKSNDKSDTCVTIGCKDMELALKLIRAGSSHRKFLRQIFVSADITAPLYWWMEYATYKVGTCENSESTMHTLMKKPLTFEDFAEYSISSTQIDIFNELIKEYSQTKDDDIFIIIKRQLPCGYLQKRTCTLNYEIIMKIYNERKNHRLEEWRYLCNVLYNNLPYLQIFIDAQNK